MSAGKNGIGPIKAVSNDACPPSETVMRGYHERRGGALDISALPGMGCSPLRPQP